jgi:hypothetical protein
MSPGYSRGPGLYRRQCTRSSWRQSGDLRDQSIEGGPAITRRHRFCNDVPGGSHRQKWSYPASLDPSLSSPAGIVPDSATLIRMD